jgi:acyl-coenzyme A synthetase/AMP-(fatty) acid ligase
MRKITFITGRVDDVINVAGHRLSTSEMEEVVSPINLLSVQLLESTMPERTNSFGFVVTIKH